MTGAVLCGLMLDVARALVPAGDDDRQTVFSEEPIAGPAYLVIAGLVGMVVLLVGETGRIENQMVVNMPLINVGGKYRLVLATQYFLPTASRSHGLPLQIPIAMVFLPTFSSSAPHVSRWKRALFSGAKPLRACIAISKNKGLRN